MAVRGKRGKSPKWDMEKSEYFYVFRAPKNPVLELKARYSFSPSSLSFSLSFGEEEESRPTSHLFCQACKDSVLDGQVLICDLSFGAEQERFARFTAQWWETFRRGCWLSGCAIEASAHEKAEWMQGFSREEIEAWGLKL